MMRAPEACIRWQYFPGDRIGLVNLGPRNALPQLHFPGRLDTRSERCRSNCGYNFRGIDFSAHRREGFENRIGEIAGRYVASTDNCLIVSGGRHRHYGSVDHKFRNAETPP